MIDFHDDVDLTVGAKRITSSSHKRAVFVRGFVFLSHVQASKGALHSNQWGGVSDPALLSPRASPQKYIRQISAIDLLLFSVSQSSFGGAMLVRT